VSIWKIPFFPGGLSCRFRPKLTPTAQFNYPIQVTIESSPSGIHPGRKLFPEAKPSSPVYIGGERLQCYVDGAIYK
jgi:hypothetical protein